MKAMVLTRYGPPEVFALRDVDMPVCGDRDVLIRVRASSVGYGDLLVRKFDTVSPRTFTMPFLFWLLAKIGFGFRTPRMTILGAEVSGEIHAVGKEVAGFHKGDQVFAYPGPAFGGQAQYLRMPAKGMVGPKPANLSHEEAATMAYGATTAWSLLDKTAIKPGDRVLVNGASGAIGSFAVQIAKYKGAEVTGVCGGPRMDLVRSLGADRVLDYRKDDFTQGGETYDLILDILGKSSFSRCRRVLAQRGVYMRASFKARHLLQMLMTRLRGGQRLVCALAPDRPDTMRIVRELAEEGRIVSTVDKTFPLERLPDAHRYAEQGHRKGAVAITIP